MGDTHLDGYNWKKKGGLKQNNKVRYQCEGVLNGIRCLAEKHVSIPFGKFKLKKKLIEYISIHSCTPSSSSMTEIITKKVHFEAEAQGQAEEFDDIVVNNQVKNGKKVKYY